MTAARADNVGNGPGPMRVATKYVRVAREYFAREGQQVAIIPLAGAMEIAPLMGLADCIVDIVDTGNTLKANGLVPLATIADISARLIVNRASMKTRFDEVEALVARLRELTSR
jgi:ATP phosphoribosyltransferase